MKNEEGKGCHRPTERGGGGGGGDDDDDDDDDDGGGGGGGSGGGGRGGGEVVVLGWLLIHKRSFNPSKLQFSSTGLWAVALTFIRPPVELWALAPPPRSVQLSLQLHTHTHGVGFVLGF